MEIRLLGLVEASLDGRPIALGGAKPRALLAVLALHVNAPVTVDRLIEALWGEEPPASAAKLVQLYVSQLRRVLDGAGAEILTRGRGYELRMPADSVDAVRFERLVDEASAGEALALWRGSPLGDIADEPFAAAEIRRLEELWLRARELDLDAALAAGEHGRVLAELDELAAEHPLREHLHAQRMLALYRCGRQAEALEAYRAARRVLVEEIGVEPGPELRRLHEAILAQDAALDLPAAVRAPPAPADARRRQAIAVAAACAAVALALVAVLLLGGGRSGLDRLSGDSVGVIDAGDGSIAAQYSVGHAPGAAVAGAGSVWVTNPSDGTVSRIDERRRQVTTLEVGGEPTAMAFGAGSLWVADGEGRRLDQVDPDVNRVVRRLRVGNAPRGVATTPGAVWVASAVDGDIVRIPLDGGRRRRHIAIGGGPVAMAAGAGAMWALSEEADVLRRLDPRSGATVASIGVGHGPAAVLAGAGAIWVANRDDGTVSRVDPATNAVSDVVRVGGEPVALAVGDGGIWVADARGARLARIDPRARGVSRRVFLGATPSGLAFAHGSVWATALPARASHIGGTLRVESPGFRGCNCIDPAGYDGDNWPLLAVVYDGLVSYRHVGGAAGSELVGDLATTVPEPADGGRTYVFQLRRGLRFSNGAPVRPTDFRSSMERMLRLTAGAAPPTYAGIVGAESCSARRCDLSRGIETDDAAGTVTIHLSRPDFELPHKLALPLAAVVPAGSPVRLARSAPLPGTGPYRIAGVTVGRQVRLVRNRGFRPWSPAAQPAGFPDAIVAQLSADQPAQVAAVRAGRADVLPIAGALSAGLPAPAVRALALSDPGRVHSGPVAALDYIFLNDREPPFDDGRVRRAFNYAIDRRRAVALVGGPVVASPTCQIISPGLPGYVPACRYGRGAAGGPDLARARRLVAASGTHGARVRLWTFGGRFAPVARYAVGVLRGLGYDAGLHVISSPAAYFGAIGDPGRHPQAGVQAWLSDYLSPSTFIQPMFACLPARAAANFSRYCDRAVDAAARRAVAANGASANGRWAAIDRRIMRAAPIVPLDNPRTVLLVSRRVGNVQQHLQLGPLLDQMWVR